MGRVGTKVALYIVKGLRVRNNPLFGILRPRQRDDRMDLNLNNSRDMKIRTVSLQNERMIKMNDARETAWMDEVYIGQTIKSAKTRRNRNNHTKPYDLLADLGPCPCSVDQVYSLGVRIQYYVGDIYLELERLNQGVAKNQYKKLALSQLDGKNEVEKLANINLNKLLSYFYNNGGPIIDSPVSEQMARELRPFYIRISTNFLKQLDLIVSLASKGYMSVSELECTINNSVTEMYSAMSMLFPVDEMKEAFDDLTRVRESISNNSK